MGVSHISDRSGRQSRWTRRGILAAFGAVPAAALAGCGASADASPAADGKDATGSARAVTTKKATITITPASGTRKAEFDSPVEVTVTDGTLASVTVTGTGTCLGRTGRRAARCRSVAASPGELH
ncbi:hypothetical protein [Streptomyces sp. HUAS TT20]|uniref:hypothetical protein n=1 Tax=Streptomyces sp. HUAS TT20 TaxID=3447509 RepID=UPI0021D857AE|nr:hypothetical protein [Streptomyces sp. HUAS 15-9]UXY31111.1 hypothetical protein N8I87_34205 [Streptomyces sp. HUAS 15-9]